MLLKEVIELNKVFEKIQTLDLDINIVYEIYNLQSIINSDLDFYFKKLNEIIEKYGEKDEKGNILYDKNNNIKINKDKISDCNQELLQLENIKSKNEYYISSKFIDILKEKNIQINLIQFNLLEKIKRG